MHTFSKKTTSNVTFCHINKLSGAHNKWPLFSRQSHDKNGN